MTGAAPIYKSLLPSVGQVMQFGERNRQLQEQRALEAAKYNLEQQAKDLDKAFSYKPNPVMAEYQPYITDKLRSYQDKWTSLTKERHPMAKTIIANDQADLNSEINIIKDVEGRMNDARLNGKDPIYNANEANLRIARTIRDEKGNLLPPMGLDPDAPLKALQGPGVVNPVAWAQGFAKGVDEDVKKQFAYVTDRQGRQFEQKWQTTNKFARMRPGDIDPEYDQQTGRIQLNITPELLSKALGTKGGQQLIQEKIDEHVASGDKRYSPSDALRDILNSTGYSGGGFKKELLDQNLLNKSEMNSAKYIGGSAQNEQNYMGAADYFQKLIHGNPEQKNSLLGDFQSRDWSTSYQTSYQGEPASKRGYIVVNYDPANKAAVSLATAYLPKETRDKLLKEHKFPINLDNEDRALTELNYWRNQARNADLNPDFLREAYKKTRKGASEEPIKLAGWD